VPDWFTAFGGSKIGSFCGILGDIQLPQWQFSVISTMRKNYFDYLGPGLPERIFQGAVADSAGSVDRTITGLQFGPWQRYGA
jgi:hypothetical protein